MKSFVIKLIRIASSVSLLIFICFLPAKCQEKQVNLVLGVPVKMVLKPGEKHRFVVDLETDRFAYFTLLQESVDVRITTINPEGKSLESFNRPNGRNGSENMTLFSETKGNYILEITSIDEKAPEGKYMLSWDKLEPRGTTFEKQIDQLFTPWNSPESPGATVAVTIDGKVVFKKGYGSAELEYSMPVTPSTVFHIASVSKQFTCFAILLLEKDGKLSINDDIRKYIPEVPNFGEMITLNHLIHHTSGLRDQWELLAMAGWRLDDIITREHILNLVSHQKELNFNPGEEHLYCNTGYTLLAEVVSRVSGQTFAEFNRTHIFEPLNMNNTQFYDDCEKIVKNRAYSYYCDSTGYKKSLLNYSNVGATSLFTTAEDLCLWAVNFENPVVGGSEIIERMNLPCVLNKGDTIPYAMGQIIGKYKGLRIISHTGGDAGYRSYLIRFPDERFSINVLSNLASFNTGGMVVKIIDIYLKDRLITTKPKTKKAGSTAPTSAKSAGLPDFDPEAVELNEYEGEFYSTELRTSYSLSVKSGKLTATHFRTGDIVLEPIRSDQFKGNKWYFSRIEFVRDPDNNISGFRVTCDRTRNLKFTKTF